MKKRASVEGAAVGLPVVGANVTGDAVGLAVVGDIEGEAVGEDVRGADVGLRTQQPSTHVSKLLLMHRKISTVAGYQYCSPALDKV